MESEIVNPEVLYEESSDTSLRPGRLRDFLGQENTKRALQIAIDAARARKEPLEHILFYGPPGLGKTTLATLIAAEMGNNIQITSAPVLEKPSDLATTLSRLNEGDILFIDEIHRLKPYIEEFLYPAMEDFRMDIRLGEGTSSEILSIPLQKFTLIGATTKAGLLTAPMRARFGIVERLDYYTPEELSRIVQRSAKILSVACTEDGAEEIAKRSRGTPRITNRLLKRVRDYAQVKGLLPVDKTVAAEAMRLLNVDEYGLDDMDVRMLKTLIDNFQGGPVGVNTIAASLSEDSKTIEDMHEPYLIQNGFLLRTQRGRQATPKAYVHLGYPTPDQNS